MYPNPPRSDTRGNDFWWTVSRGGTTVVCETSGGNFVYLVQAAIRQRMGASVRGWDGSVIRKSEFRVDGIWGAKTSKALWAMARALGVPEDVLRRVQAEGAAQTVREFSIAAGALLVLRQSNLDVNLNNITIPAGAMIPWSSRLPGTVRQIQCRIIEVRQPEAAPTQQPQQQTGQQAQQQQPSQTQQTPTTLEQQASAPVGQQTSSGPVIQGPTIDVTSAPVTTVVRGVDRGNYQRKVRGAASPWWLIAGGAAAFGAIFWIAKSYDQNRRRDAWSGRGIVSSRTARS